MRGYLMLDVGGTSIKAGVLGEDGRLLDGGSESFDAGSGGEMDVIFHHLADILRRLWERLPEGAGPPGGIGMAFPGPFDYENGVSLMAGLGKYDAIYGCPIREGLGRIVHGLDDVPMVFAHDVEAFALGEGDSGGRALYLCVGTGAGSAFTMDGRICKAGEGVPENGWIYSTPFREGIIDDYISARGLARLSQKHFGVEREGRELYRLAIGGDPCALLVFNKFGGDLLGALAPFLSAFRPDVLVFGGQIAKSFRFFGGPVEAFCRERGISVRCSENTSQSVFKGLLARLLR